MEFKGIIFDMKHLFEGFKDRLEQAEERSAHLIKQSNRKYQVLGPEHQKKSEKWLRDPWKYQQAD